MAFKNLTTANKRGDRLAELKTLARILAERIDICESTRDLPALSRQYRETIKEIEEIEGVKDDGDEIADLLAGRAADGKPGAIRKARAAV